MCPGADLRPAGSDLPRGTRDLNVTGSHGSWALSLDTRGCLFFILTTVPPRCQSGGGEGVLSLCKRALPPVFVIFVWLQGRNATRENEISFRCQTKLELRGSLDVTHEKTMAH